MNGILVIDKPEGITSFDVVKTIRNKFKIKRVGHCGTLDPLATGLLVILLGNSTKLFCKFSAFDKAYEATLQLGLTTASGDIEGSIIDSKEVKDISFLQIQKVFSEFKGEISQTPPMFSALKFHGRKLYELARIGVEVPRKPRSVKIHDLEIKNFNLPYVDFYVHCSKGTYIRSLANDIGRRLGCGASIVKIRRISIGPFKVDEAITIDSVNESHIRNWSS